MSSTPKNPLERCLTLSRMNNSELTDKEVMNFIYALEALHKETTLYTSQEEIGVS